MLAKAKLPPSLVEVERKRNSRRRLKRILFLIFLVGFLTAAVTEVFFSDFFDVKVIEVTGNESVVSEEVIKAAEVAAVRMRPIYKLLGSRNVLFWTTKEMPEPMEGAPQVASFKVVRDLSERSINIEVVEREKFVVWCEGECFWIDEKGIIFSEAPETEGALIKIVRVNSERRLMLGERPLPEKEIQTFVQIVRFLDDLGFAVASIKIEDLRFKEINVTILNGPRVLFSLLINPVFGKPVIESLKESGTWEKIDYLDLRVDGRAYYKLR